MSLDKNKTKQKQANKQNLKTLNDLKFPNFYEQKAGSENSLDYK